MQTDPRTLVRAGLFALLGLLGLVSLVVQPWTGVVLVLVAGGGIAYTLLPLAAQQGAAGPVMTARRARSPERTHPMNRYIAAAAAVLAVAAGTLAAPAAIAAGPAAALAATAPDPCSVPMVFTGMDASYTEHVFYRAGCSSPAVPLNSLVPFTRDQPVLMPDSRHVISGGISSSQDPNTVDVAASLVITDIATDTTTPVAQSGPTASWSKNGLSVAPDGSAVAFEVGNAEASMDGVFVQPLNGSPSYRVSPVATAGGYPTPGEHTAWSHDGKYIAYPAWTTGTAIAWARSDRQRAGGPGHGRRHRDVSGAGLDSRRQGTADLG